MTPPSARPTGRRAAARTAAAAVAAALAVTAAPAVIGTPAAMAAPGPESTLVVHADEPFREATQMASGSLYGIAADGVPSDDLIAPLKPDTFVQMPPGGTQQPTGDTLDVWRAAERNGAGVVVRIVDYYPGWPYRFDFATEEDKEAYADVVRGIIADIEEAGVTNVVAYAPWNEPDLTWREEQNGSFLDFWEFSYDLLREEAPGVPIQGPAFSTDISGMREFMEFAVATDTVPDVLEWHELISPNLIQGHVETVDGILADVGLDLDDIPVDVTEYATPQEVGIPGDLVPYLARLERYGIDRAELPFWNQSGALGDLLTGRGGEPNGAYWLYTWYADMEGDVVTTTPPSNQSPLDGFATVSEDRDEVQVITGGAQGATSVVVDGLDALDLGDTVDVTLEVTPSYGRTTATEGPITISTTPYDVGEDGSITVPVVMNPAYGYHVVVRPASGGTESLEGRYTIENGLSGLFLDTVDDGDVVVQTDPAAEPAETWQVIDAGRGLYEVVDPDTGLRLAVEGGATANGAAAVVEADDDSEDQLWQLVPDGDGRVRLANYGTGLTLAVDGGSTEAGAAVIQWTDGSPQSTCRPDGPRTPGAVGTALDFCGTDSYVQMPEGVLTGLDGDWTIATWVNPTALPTWARIFDFGSGQGANMFLTVSAGNGPRFAITTSGAGGEQQITWSGQNLALDQWSHVAVTVSGTTGRLWVDGEVVATNEDVTVSPADLGPTTRNYIGNSQYSSDPAFAGAVDDFAVYSRALSADELAALAGGEAADGDVLTYAFDEVDGSAVVEDTSGQDQDGQVVVASGNGTTTTATDEELADRFWTLVPADEPEWATDVSLADVLGDDTSGPESPRRADGSDLDLLTFAVQRVLAADPDSPVSVLTDPAQPLTAFLPDDDAFVALLAEVTRGRVPNEKVAAGRLRSAFTTAELEQVLLDHVVLDATLTSEQVLAADGAVVQTAGGSSLQVSVQDGVVRLLDTSGDVVAVVDLDGVDVNLGQVQVGHAVDRVVLPG